ncbi:MAG TPA: sporulation protein YunB [Candidatus Butyricicoccus stercorigallinarum]|nr:sporulation protein YunB [Candidatus Butyricicoccus stercorigallinarum]
MELRIRTALARRRTKRRARRAHTVRWLLLAALLAASFGLHALRPLLTEYAVNYVQYQATSMMEQAVAECAGRMTELGRIQTNADGAVTSVTTDAAALNRLRTTVVRQVYDGIGALEQAHTAVPLGTLLDPQYLAGLGPALPFGVTALGRVTARVNTAFSDAGINQTIHTLTVCVTADFSVRALGMAQTVTVSAEYPLEETIVVGEVPLIASHS